MSGVGQRTGLVPGAKGFVGLAIATPPATTVGDTLIDRLAALRPVPRTRDMVCAFLDECRTAGGIPR